MPPSGPPVPNGVRLYVDGFPSPTLPPAEGLYLVQKTDGRFWNTRLVHDEELPLSWVESPVDKPPRIASWGRLGLAVGPSSQLQLPSWTSDVYPRLEDRRVLLGAQGDLQLTFLSPFGVLAHLSALVGPELTLDGSLSAIWSWRGLTIGGGLGAASFSEVYYGYGATRTTTQRSVRLPYPQGTVLVRTAGLSRWDVSVSAGGSASVIRYEIGSGLLFPEISGERYRIGLAMDARTGRFVQQGIPDRTVRLSSSLLLVRLDWVRGEY